MNRSLLIAILAFTLTIGATSAAYALDGDHHEAPGHRSMEHGSGNTSNAKHTPTIAFNAHGGGHEQAADNNAIHEREMKEPSHRD